MIVSFRDAWLRDFVVRDIRSKRIPTNLETRLFRRLQMLDDAATDADLRVPPSNHLESVSNARRPAFDPRERAAAACFPVERQQRRGVRSVSR
jgi:proteic killer suppression protein